MPAARRLSARDPPPPLPSRRAASGPAPTSARPDNGPRPGRAHAPAPPGTRPRPAAGRGRGRPRPSRPARQPGPSSVLRELPVPVPLPPGPNLGGKAPGGVVRETRRSHSNALPSLYGASTACSPPRSPGPAPPLRRCLKTDVQAGRGGRLGAAGRRCPGNLQPQRSRVSGPTSPNPSNGPGESGTASHKPFY